MMTPVIDWSTMSCAFRHHITYRPDDAKLADRLRAESPAGEAWRCLRCGAYIPGDPHGSGPTDDAPTPTRGKALRQLIILRLLATLRFLEGLLEIGVGVTLISLQSRVPNLIESLREELPLLVPAAERIGWDIEKSWIARTLDNFADLDSGSYALIGLGITLLGVSKWAEAIGLWLARRWGEYLAVVATGLFIPIEVRELIESVSAFKVTLFIINLAAVVWLVWAKRLFGFRGGKAATVAEHEEAALITVEKAAAIPDHS